VVDDDLRLRRGRPDARHHAELHRLAGQWRDPAAHRADTTPTAGPRPRRRNSRLGVRIVRARVRGHEGERQRRGRLHGLPAWHRAATPNVSEAAFFNNGTFRIRAAYAKVESEYVDLLAGQYYFLFGEQPFFFPMSIWFFGLPTRRSGPPHLSGPQQSSGCRTRSSPRRPNVDIAVSAQRPPQRDSEIPDFQGGLKIGVNSWKGVHAGGSGYAAFDPLTIAASGSFRHFRVNDSPWRRRRCARSTAGDLARRHDPDHPGQSARTRATRSRCPARS